MNEYNELLEAQAVLIEQVARVNNMSRRICNGSDDNIEERNKDFATLERELRQEMEDKEVELFNELASAKSSLAARVQELSREEGAYKDTIRKELHDEFESKYGNNISSLKYDLIDADNRHVKDTGLLENETAKMKAAVEINQSLKDDNKHLVAGAKRQAAKIKRLEKKIKAMK